MKGLDTRHLSQRAREFKLSDALRYLDSPSAWVHENLNELLCANVQFVEYERQLIADEQQHITLGNSGAVASLRKQIDDFQIRKQEFVTTISSRLEQQILDNRNPSVPESGKVELSVPVGRALQAGEPEHLSGRDEILAAESLGALSKRAARLDSEIASQRARLDFVGEWFGHSSAEHLREQATIFGLQRGRGRVETHLVEARTKADAADTLADERARREQAAADIRRRTELSETMQSARLELLRLGSKTPEGSAPYFVDADGNRDRDFTPAESTTEVAG